MNALVRACSLEGPPSIRYVARVNGAPAKPISGVAPSSATSCRTAVCRNASRSGSSGGSASTSATERTGSATTGPMPGLISMSSPATTSGSTMSEKRIAASTPCRRTGCRVISVTRSGSWHASSIAVPARSARYSGSDRPAWRMNQTGVRRTGRPRAARTRSESEGRSGRNGSGATVTTGHSPRRTAVARPGTVIVGRRDGCGASGAVCYPAAYPAHVEPTSLASAGNRGRDAGGDEPPAEFQAALAALASVRARPEIVLEHIPAPQRLAPWAHAVGARVAEPDGERRRPRDRHARGSSSCSTPRATRRGTAPPAAWDTCRRRPTRSSSTTRCSPRSPGAG